jgi:hypothetical protein
MAWKISARLSGSFQNGGLEGIWSWLSIGIDRDG